MADTLTMDAVKRVLPLVDEQSRAFLGGRSRRRPSVPCLPSVRCAPASAGPRVSLLPVGGPRDARRPGDGCRRRRHDQPPAVGCALRAAVRHRDRSHRRGSPGSPGHEPRGSKARRGAGRDARTGAVRAARRRLDPPLRSLRRAGCGAAGRRDRAGGAPPLGPPHAPRPPSRGSGRHHGHRNVTDRPAADAPAAVARGGGGRGGRRGRWARPRGHRRALDLSGRR